MWKNQRKDSSRRETAKGTIHERGDVITNGGVSMDVLMMPILLDAKEHRDVATADVAGAYLHADMKDFTLLRMAGEPVDIMCDV
jgi:hypothetical protein